MSLGEDRHRHLYYLVTINCYSNFWEVNRLPNTKASTTIVKLKSHRYGIQDQVFSDNEPQFTADEFAEFSKNWILSTLQVALEIAKPMARPSLG